VRTRFAPVAAPAPRPAREEEGVHLRLGELLITGMRPEAQPWGGLIWFQTLTGWWDAPSTTGDSTQYLAADGAWTNTAYWTPRVIEITGLLTGPDRASVRQGIETLMGQIPKNNLVPLVVMEDGLIRHCMVRMAGDPAADWADGPKLMASWNIQLVAPDPRRLAGDGTQSTGWVDLGPTGLPASTGGLTFPTTFPAIFPTETISGRVLLGVTGTTTPNAIVEFRGPVTRPGIRDTTTGTHLWFDLDLDAGDTLTIDLRTRVSLLNGVSRRGARRGQWVEVRNGAVLEFTAASYNADARMLVRTQEAWI
jgi:hypothetical protein